MSISETLPRSPAGSPAVAAVYAIIPAWGGSAILERLLKSLVSEQPLLRGVLIVNNACDPETDRIAARAEVPTRVFTPSCNLGTAGGIALGMREFLALPEATHAWVLDDDAIVVAGALPAMLSAMRVMQAEAAAPLIADEHGLVRGIPCRVPGKPRRFLLPGLTPHEFLREVGHAPRRWNWAIWASVVISRRAIEAVGYPRLELWSQFTDIEYLLRVTKRFPGVLAPHAVCQHVPVASSGAYFDAKLYAALQNGCYVALRLPHGRRALRHIPGQFFRYLRHYHFRRRAWREMIAAFWTGAVLGRPSGRTMQASLFERAEAELSGLAVVPQK